MQRKQCALLSLQMTPRSLHGLLQAHAVGSVLGRGLFADRQNRVVIDGHRCEWRAAPTAHGVQEQPILHVQQPAERLRNSLEFGESRIST